MSQLLMATTIDGEPCDVMIGWMRNAQRVFISVGYVYPEGGFRDDVDLILEVEKHLPVRPVEIAEAAGVAEGVQHKLARLHIQMPDKMLSELAAHIVLDTGNVIARYDAQGHRTAILGVLTAPC